MIAVPFKEKTWYAIHEVYHEHGVPVPYGQSPADPGWTNDDGPNAGLNQLEKYRYWRLHASLSDQSVNISEEVVRRLMK